MATPPRLIDRRALGMMRRRALKAGGGADFLLDRVAEDLSDRLAATLRPFAIALDLATPGDQVARMLRTAPGRAVFRASAMTDEGGDLVCDPEALPFAAESLDLIVSALALHFIDDLPGLLVQAKRSLKPDGLFLAAALGGDTLFELRSALAIAEERLEGGVSPRVMPFADVRAFGGLLQRAGFALPVTDVDRVTVRYEHPLKLIEDLRGWGATNALAERRRSPLKRETLRLALETYAERHADADGRVRATFEIVWLSGWAPHASQQQPLRPGSAKTRLAEALGVPEIKAP